MITNLAKTPEQLDTLDYSAMLYETTNLFKKMGSAMSMAFSDISSKAEIIKENKAFLREMFPGEQHDFLQETILKEMELDVLSLNGENNHKLLPKDMKGTWQYKYTSTTRTILRTVWLMDFLALFFAKLTKD
jgi:Glycolipid transfer protein (GLTP)